MYIGDQRIKSGVSNKLVHSDDVRQTSLHEIQFLILSFRERSGKGMPC